MNLFNYPEPNKLRDHNGRFIESPFKCTSKIKYHFESGLSLTVRECWKLYGTSELRVYVARFRKEGMNIIDTYHARPDGSNWFKVYRLSQKEN